MGGEAEGKLFPDKLHFCLFWTYVGLFVNQGILVTASKEADGTYAYNTTTVVILTETVKLILAIYLFLRDHHFDAALLFKLKEWSSNMRLGALYLVPAFLYCLYNNLAFVNLGHYDPASYFLLLNFRTVLTGVIFQFLFKKQLARRQWLALIILTLGCVVKQVELDNLSSIRIKLDIHLLLMLTQNMFMYGNSIVMNVLFMAYSGTLLTALSAESTTSVLRPIVLSIALNNGIAGITTSLFLKNFNSILKTFAGAIELMLTAVVAWVLFGVAVNGLMVVSIALVSLAMYLYSTQPVNNKVATPGIPQAQ